MARQRYSDAFHAILIFLVFVEGRGKDEWKSYQSSSYLFVNQTKNYTEAQTYCKQRLSNLVSITSEMENDFIVNLTKTSMKWEKNDIGIWLGATDNITEGSFVWENGDPWNKTLDLWNFGEPNDYANQDCLVTGPVTNYTWDDQWCNKFFRFICEKMNYESSMPPETTMLFSSIMLPESTTSTTVLLSVSTIDTSEIPDTSSSSVEVTSLDPPTNACHFSNYTCSDKCLSVCCKTYQLRDETLESVKKRFESLRVDKKNTSKYRRSLTSAEDTRFSSAVIGNTAIIVLVTVGLIIVACDLSTLYGNFKGGRKNIHCDA